MVKYDALVLSGGGEKALVELGVLHYYFESGAYDPTMIKEYSGASIGSVLCLLLICGYTPMDIFQKVYNFENFLDVTDTNSVWKVVKDMGVLPISFFSSKVTALIQEKLGEIPTLEKLRELTGKTLYISAVSVTNMKEIKISPDTHPTMSCIEAIEESCNLPLIFQRFKYGNEYMVDGGLLNNFPWNYISSKCERILGIVVTGSDFTLPDDTFMGYFYRLVVMPVNQLTELRCRIAPPKVDIVKLKCEGVAVFRFVMDNDKKMDLFLSGYGGAVIKEKTKPLYVEDWNDKVDGWEIDDLDL